MIVPISYALISAGVFAALLRVANALPRRPDGQAAVATTLGVLFLLSWAGGMWGRVMLGFATPHPFPFLFAGMLGSLALAPYAVPVRSAGPRLPPRTGSGLATVPFPRLWWLMSILALSIVARYALEAS